jgi:hypothetical protein
VLVLMCTCIEMSWQGSVSDAIPLTLGVECDPATLNKELLVMVYRNMGAQRFTEKTQLLSQTVEAQFPSIAHAAMAAHSFMTNKLKLVCAESVLHSPSL